MNRLSKLTLDALVPLPLVELKPASSPQPRLRTLTDLMRQADGVMLGTITRTHLFRIERLVGEESYFTTISLQGSSLVPSQRSMTRSLEITFKSGSIQANRGVFDPLAPSADELRAGTSLILFHKWMSDLGAGLKGNGLVGLKAGLYLTRRGAGSIWVRGRGKGFGIAHETPLSELAHRIERIESQKPCSRASQAYLNPR